MIKKLIDLKNRSICYLSAHKPVSEVGEFSIKTSCSRCRAVLGLPDYINPPIPPNRKKVVPVQMSYYSEFESISDVKNTLRAELLKRIKTIYNEIDFLYGFWNDDNYSFVHFKTEHIADVKFEELNDTDLIKYFEYLISIKISGDSNYDENN